MTRKRGNKKDKILGKLDELERKIEKVQREEKRIEHEEKATMNKLDKITHEEEEIERTLIKFAGINLKKRHLYELLRASAGAFLGVGLGRSLLGLDNVARTLPWLNVLGILAFVLIISGLLIYKNEKSNIKKEGIGVVWQRLFFIYFVSLLIEFLSLLLFQVKFDDTSMLFKIMIVGSFTAMASAVSFSLDK